MSDGTFQVCPIGPKDDRAKRRFCIFVSLLASFGASSVHFPIQIKIYKCIQYYRKQHYTWGRQDDCDKNGNQSIHLVTHAMYNLSKGLVPICAVDLILSLYASTCTCSEGEASSSRSSSSNNGIIRQKYPINNIRPRSVPPHPPCPQSKHHLRDQCHYEHYIGHSFATR